jgi:hypothetical protein
MSLSSDGIPEVWAKQVLQTQLEDPFWARFGPFPDPKPLTRRQRWAIARRNLRERIARRVYPEGDWGYDPWDD